MPSVAQAMSMAAEHNPDIIVLDFPYRPLADFSTAIPLKQAAPSTKLILFTFGETVKFLHPHLPMFSAVVYKTEAATLLDKARSLVARLS